MPGSSSNAEQRAFDAIDRLTDSPNIVEDSDEELANLATFPGFIDLTRDDFEEEPTTSESSRVRRHDSIGNFCQAPPSQEQIISSSEPLDLPSEASEQPGPSSAVPPKKRRHDNGSSPQRNTSTAPREEINCDRRVGTGDDLSAWTESQVNAWDCSSWTSDRDDESTVRGRQTPYPFHNVSEGEEEEQEEEERGGARWKHKLINKIDAVLASNNRIAEGTLSIQSRLDVIGNRLDVIGGRLDSLGACIQEDHARSAAEFATIRNGMRAEFGAVHNRIDELGVGHREIIGVIQAEIHRLQRIVEENFARVERSENDQMRERQLSVSLLSALVTAAHPN